MHQAICWSLTMPAARSIVLCTGIHSYSKWLAKLDSRQHSNKKPNGTGSVRLSRLSERWSYHREKRSLLMGRAGFRVRRGAGPADHSLIHKHFHFHAPVQLASRCGVVCSGFVAGAQSGRSQNPVDRDVALLLKILNHGVGPLFAQLLVESSRTSLVGESRDLNHVAFFI